MGVGLGRGTGVGKGVGCPNDIGRMMDKIRDNMRSLALQWRDFIRPQKDLT